MIHKSLLASAVILCSTVAFTSAAKADTTDVHFTGSVPASCTFSNVTNGTLGLTAAGTTLSSLTGGTAGTARLTCNNIVSTLTADAPAKTSAPTGYDNSTATKTVSVTGSGANTIAINAAGVSVPMLVLGTTNLAVNMSTTTTSVLPSGNYDFYVRLTAAGL